MKYFLVFWCFLCSFCGFAQDNNPTRKAYFNAHKALDEGDSKALEILLKLYPNLPAGITAEQSEDVLRKYYVHDLAQILKEDERKALNGKLMNVHKMRKVQIGIAIFPTLEGKKIEDVAEQVAKVWNLNYQSKKGLLVLVALNDRKMRLHVLSEMRGLISDDYAVQLLNTYLKPAFKEKKYAEGLINLATKFENIVRD